MNQPIDCPCTYTVCEYYLKCEDCKKHHSNRKAPAVCERETQANRQGPQAEKPLTPEK